MSKVDLNLSEAKQAGSSEEDTASKSLGDVTTPQSTQLTRKSRRTMPAILATSFSILWTAAAAFYIVESATALSTLAPVELASLVAGYSTPIAIFWLVALTFQRTDPLLEHRLAIARNLHKAVAPVEVAEQRLLTLNKNLQKELTNIDAVADLAADRIKNLEGRFQSQISDLFSATADTEARTVSIRDILSREKEAIGALASELEARMSNLEKTVGEINTNVENAGTSAAATADHARERVNTSLNAFGQVTEDFETRLDRASANVTSRVNEVQDIAVDVELRLQAVTDKVLGGMEKFRHDVENLEGRSAELSDHMTTQGTVLKELAELAALESAKIEETLRSHVSEVRTAASDALESTHSVSEVFSERAQGMADKMVETITAAKAMLEDAGQSMQAHCNAALTTSEEVAQKTRATTEETGKQVLEHARRVDQVLDDGLARAKRSLEATMDAVTNHSAAAAAEAEATAERTLQHIRQLRAGVEQQMADLAAAGAEAGDSLITTAASIGEETDNLSAKAKAARDDIREVQDAMSGQSQELASLLNDTRMKLSHLEEDLIRQREALSAASDDAASKVIEAAERFMANSQALEQSAVSSSTVLSEKSDHLTSKVETLQSRANAATDGLTASGEALEKASSKLDQKLAETSGKLASAAEAFAGERERIIDETGAVIKRLDQSTDRMDAQLAHFAESSSEAANRLDSASQALVDQAARAEEQMRRSVEETGKELTASLSHISDDASQRITYLQEAMEATLARVLSDYQKTAEQAEKESALLAMRLGNESSKIAQQAAQFIEKTAEIEKRIASATKNDFARTSQLLLESLQSVSIDVNRALSHDLPDSVWQEYLKGDKSVFMRRTLKIADRSTRKTIADKYRSDGEFREAVSRYCRDFEGMMERVMLGDKGSALSVTLISSDMGKLYVLLAQSLKKIN